MDENCLWGLGLVMEKIHAQAEHREGGAKGCNERVDCHRRQHNGEGAGHSCFDLKSWIPSFILN